MKLRIFYRHYNVEGTNNKGRPNWFDYEKCFINLLDTIKKRNDTELHVIMDGDINSNFISKYQDYFTLHEIKVGSDYLSFRETYKIAKSIEAEDNDLYYFLENDYLHIPNWVDKVIELFTTYSNLNYVSLYDHNDKYFLPMYDDLVSKIFTTDTHHWRTTPSTCGTYIINKKIFLEDYDIHTSVNGDHNKFLWLNENKGRFVTTPIPGLNTHCMEGLLSPTIDWKNV